MFCAGQKYLLKELRRHLEQGTSLSQQLQSQLASFDRQTRNYSPSLTTPLQPSSQNSTAVAARHPPDVLVVLGDQPSSPSASGTVNSGNDHAPTSEAWQTDENARAAGTSYHELSPTYYRSPSYYSDDETDASRSPAAANHLSRIDEEEEFEAADGVHDDGVDGRTAADFMGEYSNDESDVDEDFRSRVSQEDVDSDSDRSDALFSAPEAYTDSDNESRDGRRTDSESGDGRYTGRPRRALDDAAADYNDDDAATGRSPAAAGRADDRGRHAAYARAAAEDDTTPVRLRLNTRALAAGWSGDAGTASDASDDDAAASGRGDVSDGSSSVVVVSERTPRRRHASTSSASSDVDSDADLRRPSCADAGSTERRGDARPASSSARSSTSCERRSDDRWSESSDDSSAGRRPGVKRLRSAGTSSATDSDTDAERRRPQHKQHRRR